SVHTVRRPWGVSRLTGVHVGSPVVTGGSRGIGRAVVERLRAGGDAVTTCGRGATPADLPDDLPWVRAGVADPAAARSIVAVASECNGPVTVLVNNAGVCIERS